ncbi:MAG: FHA domain-containing protein [Planctomycetales bacterium]|nr:FHA domain-containing protein [Planctomycetales bacterium]
MFGEMIPQGGGDAIPLLKDKLLVGRRESCDIRLRFANVSAHHCELTMENGYWFIKDLKSRNGIKVNNVRVQHKRIDPGDIVSVAKHRYEFQYSPMDNGAIGPPPPEDTPQEQIMSKSLLERAGLVRSADKIGSDTVRKRYNPADNRAGQIKDPNRPI